MIYYEVVHQVVVLASNFHNILYHLNVASLWLAASRSTLATCPGYPEAWSLKLVAIDHDPGTVLGPSIGHDLELSRDGCQLARCRVTNFYCEFFTHQSFSIFCILITAS